MTAVFISSTDSNCLPQIFLSHVLTTNNHCKIQKRGRMCQHLPAPTPHHILHIMTTMRCCIVLKQPDMVLKPFWLFTANSRPHLTLQECAVILAIDHCNNWRRIVKHKSILSQEHDMHDFQSTLTAQGNFFSLVMFGHTIQHSVISAEGHMNASMTHQPLTCNCGMHCLHFSNAANGWWHTHTQLLGHY